MTKNIDVELNMAFGEINSVSPNFIPPTFQLLVLKLHKGSSYVTNI